MERVKIKRFDLVKIINFNLGDKPIGERYRGLTGLVVWVDEGEPHPIRVRFIDADEPDVIFLKLPYVKFHPDELEIVRTNLNLRFRF